MKIKNLYYRSVIRRGFSLKGMMLNFFLTFSVWLRTFIENFTRRGMGLRYYSLTLCVLCTLVLAILPITFPYNYSFFSVISHDLTWYGFLIAYMYSAVKRHKEIERKPGNYDLQRYSLSEGKVHPYLLGLDFFRKWEDRRMIPILCEPSIFFGAGLILLMFFQPIGFVLIISSIFYSLSWAAQFYNGDQFVLDTIDEMIVNENLVNSFVRDLPPDETKGFEFHGHRPTDHNFRRKVADAMIDEEPAVDVL